MEIISEVSLLRSNPTSTPLEPNYNLAKATGTLCTHSDDYRRLIGKLILLSITRLDLSYVFDTLPQFIQALHIEYWDATLRVVCFLKGTLGQGILLSVDTPMKLLTYYDSN